MSRVLVAAAVLALAPVAARAEPISVMLNSATSGFSSPGEISADLH
jgi:hypothetical protein